MTASSDYPDLDALLKHSGWVRSLAQSLVSDFATAEDIEQRTWLAAMERPPKHAVNPRAWLGRVVRNFAGMHWRENSSRRRREEIVGARRRTREVEGESKTQPDSLAERMDTFGKLANAIVNLPAPYAPTIFLRFFEELTIREIATRMEASEAVVKARIARGLTMLRQQLGSSLGEDWRAKCWVFTVPITAIPASTLATVLTMTMKTKLFLAASSIVLISLISILAWKNTAEPNPPSTTSPLSATPVGKSQNHNPALGGAYGITRTPIGFVTPTTTELPIDPNLDLSGIVVDAYGAPIAGATIDIYKPLHRHSSRVRPFSEPVLDIIAKMASDSEGRFRFRLEAGRTFDMNVSATGFGAKRLPNLYAGEVLRIEMNEAASIHGIVQDAVTGLGIPGARVIATPGVLGETGRGTYETVTDARGVYALLDLPANYETLAAFADGYVYAHSFASFVLQPGQQMRQNITLQKGGHIFGQITDANTDQPIAGAVVQTRLWSVDQSVITDADGKYILTGLDPAIRERIYVTAPGYGRYDWTVSSLIPDAGLEVNLGLLPGRSANGRIVDSKGTPIKGAYVSANLRYTRPVYFDTQADYLFTRTSEDGTFSFEDLRVDLRHSLLVAAEGFGSEVFDFPISEWDSLTLDLGDIVLESASSISGQVFDLEGKPVPEIWVTLRGESVRRDMLGPVLEGGEGYSSEPGFGMGTTQAHTDERGRYSFSDLPAGDFYLWAGAKGYARGAEGLLSLKAGENVADLNLTLDAGYSIRGIVVDAHDQPIAGASVSAAPYGVWQPRVTYNLSASDGTFFLTGLEPKEYTLRCDEGFQSLVDADGLRRRFAEIIVEKVAAGTDGVRIALPSALLTSGVIIGPDGAPVPEAIVYEKTYGLAPGDYFMPWLATADERGEFSIWIAEETSKAIFVYPSLHSPTNQYGIRQYLDNGKVDFSFEVAVDIPAGTVDFLIELPKVPAKK